ncbi:MAG: polymorphic toxin-type HINT domain-containing protein, partial [Chloroflexota bacterium]
LRARYYDPSIGIFIAKDPVWGFSGMSQSMNGYSYVHGNPINLTDPSGRFPGAHILAGIAAGASIGAAAGSALGAAMYTIQLRGDCGCERQQEAMEQGRGAFMRRYAGEGAKIGAMMGFFLSLGPVMPAFMMVAPGVAQTLLGVVALGGGAVSFITGSAKMASATKELFGDDYNPFDDTNPNPCALIDLLLGAADVIDSLGGVRDAGDLLVNAWRTFMRNRGNHAPLPDVDTTRNPDANRDPNSNRTMDQCAVNSFSADTDVSTPDGDTPISEIKVGDTVYAYDELTGEVGEYTVTDVIWHEDPEIAYLVIDGEMIVTTPGHPFYTSDGDWVEVQDLELGDLIMNLDLEYGTVNSIEIVPQVQVMYDLTVDEVHNFAVGDGEWLVHNFCEVFLETLPYGQGLSKYADSFRTQLRDAGQLQQAREGNIAVFQLDRLPPGFENLDFMDGVVRVKTYEDNILVVRSSSTGRGDLDGHAETYAANLLRNYQVQV